MSTVQLTGKIIMNLATVIYGFVPPFVDFNATHATNPLWNGHARFHVVWQVLITICLGILGIYLLWFDDHCAFSLNISFLLGLITLVTFEINVFAFTIALVLLVVGYLLAF